MISLFWVHYGIGNVIAGSSELYCFSLNCYGLIASLVYATDIFVRVNYLCYFGILFGIKIGFFSIEIKYKKAIKVLNLKE